MLCGLAKGGGPTSLRTPRELLVLGARRTSGCQVCTSSGQDFTRLQTPATRRGHGNLVVRCEQTILVKVPDFHGLEAVTTDLIESHY